MSKFEFTFRKSLEDTTKPVPNFLSTRGNFFNTNTSQNHYNMDLTWTLVFQTVYLLTGVFNTLGSQYLYYEGAADKWSLLTVTTMYFGMSLVFFLPQSPQKKVSSEGRVDHQKILLITFLDVVAMTVLTVGLFLCGSGIYQIVYSSVVIFTALLSRVFLNKKLSAFQWAMILVVFFGLSVSALGGDDLSTDTDSKIFFGVLLTLMGAVMYGVVYVLNEKIMSGPSPASPQATCYLVGTYGTGICSLYLFFYTLPHFDSLVVQSVEAHGGNLMTVSFFYLLLIISNMAHNHSYFYLISSIGAVRTGMIHSLRAVSVFFLSAYFFCAFDTSQCLSVYKFVSAVIVVTGVTLFNLSSNKSPPPLNEPFSEK